MLQSPIVRALLVAAACAPMSPQSAPGTAPSEAVTAAAAAAPAIAAPAAGEAADARVKARLVTDVTAFVPGEERRIGATFEIADGWHLYALARNDSGSPATVDLQLPAGYGAPAALLRPVPRRHVAPGGLLDHVYEHEVTLLLPVTVPQDAAPGSVATFRAHVEWFVCKDVCMPGAADVSLAVPIVASAGERRASADAAQLRAAESRLPRPLPAHDAPLSLTLAGDTVSVRAPGAVGLTFVPDPQCVVLPQLIDDGERSGDSLALHLDAPRAADAALAGALEIRRANGASEFYAIHLATPPGPDSASR